MSDPVNNKPVRAPDLISWIRDAEETIEGLKRQVNDLYSQVNAPTPIANSSYVELNVAGQTSVVISGLDGDAEGVYEIVLHGKITTFGAAGVCRVRPNALVGVSSGGTEHYADAYGPQHGVVNRATEGLVFGLASELNQNVNARMTLYAKTGQQRALYCDFAEKRAGDVVLRQYNSYWNNTTTNITSLEIYFGGPAFTGLVTLRKMRNASIVGPQGVAGPAGANAAAQIYSQDIGNGTDTSFNIPHSLGTTNVVVTMREKASPYRIVEPTVKIPDASNVTIEFLTPPTANQYTVTVFAGYNPGTPVKASPSYDSGWIADEANTTHMTTYTHNLGLNLATETPRIEIWFAPTNPALGAPTFIAPVSVRSMWVDDPASTGMGYNNPGALRIKQNTLEYYIYSGLALYCDWTNGNWTQYQTGWIRVKIWR